MDLPSKYYRICGHQLIRFEPASCPVSLVVRVHILAVLTGMGLQLLPETLFPLRVALVERLFPYQGLPSSLKRVWSLRGFLGVTQCLLNTKNNT